MRYDMMIVNDESGRLWEEGLIFYLKELPGSTKENHKNPESG
jgi:hypothetical protein